MNWKLLKPIIPSLSIFIILLGLLKTVLYFYHFNVPIKYFIGFSELTLIISDDLILIVFFVVFPIAFTAFYLTTQLMVNKIANPNFTHDLTLNKQYKVINIVGGFLMLLNIIFAIFNRKDYVQKNGNLIFCCLIGLILLTVYLVRRIEFVSKTKVPRIYIYTVFLSIIICAVLIYTTIYEIGDVDKGKYSGTIIKTSDSTYISTAKNYFIGKTESYVFIYNKDSCTTTIIPKDGLKQMVLKINSDVSEK